jgi:hypothetical protein
VLGLEQGSNAHPFKLRGYLYIPAYPLGVMAHALKAPYEDYKSALKKTHIINATGREGVRFVHALVITEPKHGHRPP